MIGIIYRPLWEYNYCPRFAASSLCFIAKFDHYSFPLTHIALKGFELLIMNCKLYIRGPKQGYDPLGNDQYVISEAYFFGKDLLHSHHQVESDHLESFELMIILLQIE